MELDQTQFAHRLVSGMSDAIVYADAEGRSGCGTQETPIVIDGVIDSISRRRTGDRGKIYAQAYAR
jgi:hypothetical protein